ncbi:hypothetical protein CSUB_C0700 [Candidatus Caldarchaeum subterraneum]|uniref:Uncharacterized protein n=1 Tax=Caldiarchaeum subterraneum TaxID=311458 RepID=E6P9E8_CALS0|nr:hypothetical protein CSUB_C0700 [Candidatus Caldarchaeum subterraneum]
MAQDLYDSSAKIGRREFLALTSAQVAGVAAGAALAGGVGGYLMGRKLAEATVTLTSTETVVSERTLFKTETVTSTSTKTSTYTATVTQRIYDAKLDEASFQKSYSTESMNLSARLKFNPRSEVTTASLKIIYPYSLEIPLRGSGSEKNVFIGGYRIENPKPVDHYAVWDAVTKEGLKASEVLSDEQRTLVISMPLRRDEYEKSKDLADYLFGYTLSLDTLNSENTFKIAFDALVSTGNIRVGEEVRKAIVKYALNITKNNLQPFETSSLAPFISSLQTLVTQHPEILNRETSILANLSEPAEYLTKEYLTKYYFYPYLIYNIPELQKYPFFANSAALQAARIINNYLSLYLNYSSDRVRAFWVLDEVIIPRVRARINWFEKGETVLPITGKEIVDLMGREDVALIKLADSIVSHADFQFYLFRDINVNDTLYLWPIRPSITGIKNEFIQNAIYNTKIMINENSSINHDYVWEDINNPERKKIYIEGNTYIPEPDHPRYELYKYWSEIYVPDILKYGSNYDKIAMLWFRFGVLNKPKRPNGEYIHEENRKLISQLAAESLGESVYNVFMNSRWHPDWAHGDIMISLSNNMWQIILSNKERYKTPIQVKEVNGIPNVYGIKELYDYSVMRAGEIWEREGKGKKEDFKPWMEWYTSIANRIKIF